MPLDPDRLKDLNQQFDTLTKRFDAFMERKKINDAADDDDDDEDEEDLDLEPNDPAEAAMRATPNIDPDNPNSPDNDEPWWN
jgi:hypothetical protein